MNIGIIGAGSMGAGIALAFAKQTDYIVLLCDIDHKQAERAKERIADKLRRQVQRGKLDQSESEAILGRIIPRLMADMAECDVVLEAAFEDMQVKKQLFLDIKSICGENTIFASNTSSLSITELGQATGLDIVGMHFFNPADVMKLVEVTAGENTTTTTINIVSRIAEDIGKTPVRVTEAPGFVVNRILVPMINEAITVFAEGTASVEDIDTAMRLGANHPMGPLALADLIGLDICLAVMEVLQSETGEDKYRPHPLLRKMVRAGKLGCKTGIGFYKYEA